MLLYNETELIPGNNGKNCPGNGEHFDRIGNLIEYCCDECDFLICCTNYEGLCDECFERNKMCKTNAR